MSMFRRGLMIQALIPKVEAPTPDCYYDFSLGSNDDENRETIVDQSGNGNDATAYNFEWNEKGSGYKDGALMFDGVDDFIECIYQGGFSTVFLLSNLKYGIYDYSQIEPYAGSFNLYRQYTAPNYILQNTGGISYINGIKGTATGQYMEKKKLLLTVVNNTNDRNKFVIGADFNHQYLSKMTLYKFLGFKEKLTEEQIQYVIKKYNLLDGVDNIEVS